MKTYRRFCGFGLTALLMGALAASGCRSTQSQTAGGSIQTAPILQTPAAQATTPAGSGVIQASGATPASDSAMPIAGTSSLYTGSSCSH